MPPASLDDHDRSEIEFLKGTVDLADIIRGSGIELKRVGQQLMGCCPFHDDSTPSLAVTEQLWNCLGCEAGGDVLSFLQLREKIPFPQALERLRGLSRPRKLYARARPAQRPETRAEDYNRAELLARVVGAYSQRLPESRAAREYLAARGLDSAELWQAFRLGFCDGTLPDLVPQDSALRGALTHIGVLDAQGREHFRGCIVVPLEHPDEGVVGLYGRRISGEGKLAPHLYLTGRQRGVLNWQAIKLSDRVLLAESIIDALSLWMAGCRNVTALYGVRGIPQDLTTLLGTFAVREVVLCLDADEAGREATRRLGAQLAERGIQTATVPLPDGKDPNEVLVEQGPGVLRDLVEQGQSVCAAPAVSDATPPTMQGHPDGFSITLSDVVYRVAPLDASSGKLTVRLEVTRGDRTFVDKADLYSHRSRSAFGRQLIDRFKLLREETEQHFLTLLHEAEKWQRERAAREGDIEEGVLTSRTAPEMTAAEREDALAFLRRPDLVHVILADMEALGFVGEERGKLLAYLIGISRKLPRPMAGIILSQSGAGKSTLAELVEMLTPPEEMENFSRLTAQSLGYVPKNFGSSG